MVTINGTYDKFHGIEISRIYKDKTFDCSSSIISEYLLIMNLLRFQNTIQNTNTRAFEGVENKFAIGKRIYKLP